MHVLRHDDGSVQFELYAVVVQAVLENDGTSFWSKGIAGVLAKGNKYGAAGLLMVRQHPAVVVHSGERNPLRMHRPCGSGFVARTLLSEAFDFAFLLFHLSVICEHSELCRS